MAHTTHYNHALKVGLERAAGDHAAQSPAALLPGWDPNNQLFSDGFLLLPGTRVANPARRIVVLVPEREIKESELARKAWELAAPGALAVLFLACAPKTGITFRRRLAILAAITRNEQVQASAWVSAEREWLAAVEEIYNPGDLLVILDRPKSRLWESGWEQLGFIFGEKLGLPVLFLTGLKVGPSLATKNLAMQLLGWSVSLVTLVAFAWLQIQIQATLAGWVSTLAFIATVVVEIGLLLIVSERTT